MNLNFEAVLDEMSKVAGPWLSQVDVDLEKTHRLMYGHRVYNFTYSGGIRPTDTYKYLLFKRGSTDPIGSVDISKKEDGSYYVPRMRYIKESKISNIYWEAIKFTRGLQSPIKEINKDVTWYDTSVLCFPEVGEKYLWIYPEKTRTDTTARQYLVDMDLRPGQVQQIYVFGPRFRDLYRRTEALHTQPATKAVTSSVSVGANMSNVVTRIVEAIEVME